MIDPIFLRGLSFLNFRVCAARPILYPSLPKRIRKGESE